MPTDAGNGGARHANGRHEGSIAGLAIFPLSTVLFPGGVIPLRIFEARYMDMVRDCMHKAEPFGVCLITRGSEVGAAAEHEPVGCLASIVDWDMPQLGVLRIRALGGRRLRVIERSIEANGLVRADVVALADDPEVPVPAEHAACALLARRLVADLAARSGDPLERMVAEPYAFESAAWVANRLCEFMPISARARQKLMELDDPLVRLSLVHQFLEQRQVL